MLKKYYFSKEKFYLFDGMEIEDLEEKYDELELSIDEDKEHYSIWGIQGTNSELLDEEFTNNFDFSLLEYADIVEDEN